MKRSQRMAMLVALEQRKELDAAADLARLQRAQQRQDDLLSQVEHFERDFGRGVGAALEAGVSGERLAELHRMRQQTAVAVGQQSGRAAAAGVQTGRGRSNWQAARCQRRALESLAEGFASVERRNADRREQREQDDRSRP